MESVSTPKHHKYKHVSLNNTTKGCKVQLSLETHIDYGTQLSILCKKKKKKKKWSAQLRLKPPTEANN